MQQPFKCVRAHVGVHALQVTESLMFTAGRDEEEELEERKQKGAYYDIFDNGIGWLYFEKPPAFIRHVSGDFLPHGPICSVHLNAAWVKNRLMVYSPDTRAASGTYMKHGSAGGGTHTAPRSACCGAVAAPAMSGGIWRKKKKSVQRTRFKIWCSPQEYHFKWIPGGAAQTTELKYLILLPAAVSRTRSLAIRELLKSLKSSSQS